MEARKYL